jgi:hypothetical protein
MADPFSLHDDIERIWPPNNLQPVDGDDKVNKTLKSTIHPSISMRRFFDFSSSMSHFLGIAIYGRHQRKWWRTCLVMPLWKLGRIIHRRKMRLLYRFHPAYRFHVIDTGLNPGPHSSERLILHASFSILMNSMRFRYGNLEQLEAQLKSLKDSPTGNNPHEFITSEVDFCEELTDLVQWWTITRPLDLEKAKNLSKTVYGDVHLVTITDEKTGLKSLEFSASAPEHKEQKKELRALRKKIAIEEDRMLHRLINIRRGLD